MHFLALIGLGFVINNAPRREASTLWTNACAVTNGDINYFDQQRHYKLYHYLIFCSRVFKLDGSSLFTEASYSKWNTYRFGFVHDPKVQKEVTI